MYFFFFIKFVLSVRGGHYGFSPRALSGLATPLFTVHFTHFVQGKDKNMETTKGLITLLTVFFYSSPFDTFKSYQKQNRSVLTNP